MSIPLIDDQQVVQALPWVDKASRIGQGGQKVVFKVTSGGREFVLKFLSPPDDPAKGDFRETDFGRRVIREVETMRDCASTQMVKPGPVNLQVVSIAGENLICFSEEFIEGPDLFVDMSGRPQRKAMGRWVFCES